MAIEPALQADILTVTNQFWTSHIRTQRFLDLLGGKEPGHKLADYVDECTVAELKRHFDVFHEAAKDGSPRKRSMGDAWLYSCDMYNPLNVKTGLQGQSGQPNVVSMKKLLDYLFKRWIDSYYLLIIKFSTSSPIAHDAYLVNLMDWADFFTYDAGPGQIMLREQEFYRAYDAKRPVARHTMHGQIDVLFDLYRHKTHTLFKNRRKRLAEQTKRHRKSSKSDFVVDQSQMDFVR